MLIAPSSFSFSPLSVSFPFEPTKTRQASETECKGPSKEDVCVLLGCFYNVHVICAAVASKEPVQSGHDAGIFGGARTVVQNSKE